MLRTMPSKPRGMPASLCEVLRVTAARTVRLSGRARVSILMGFTPQALLQVISWPTYSSSRLGVLRFLPDSLV